MTDPARHPTPRLRAVFAQQLRIVGLGIRREAALLAALLGLVTVAVFLEVLENGETVNFESDSLLLIAVVALLLPFAVWKDESLFGGRTYLWTLPVERRRHALIKALAGAVWLGVAAAALLLWLLALALLTGGEIGGGEIRLLLAEDAGRGPPDPGDLTPVWWTPKAWEWAAPFTAGPIAYLLGTAFVLAVKRPVRTAAALMAGVVGSLVFAEGVFPRSDLEELFEAVVAGPYGMDAALTGGAESLVTEFQAPGGQTVTAWRGLPSIERWMGGTLLWAGLGVVGLWAALLRHKET